MCTAFTPPSPGRVGECTHELTPAMTVTVVAIFVIVYLGTAWMLRIPEVSEVLGHLAGRIPPLRRVAFLTRR